MRYLFFLMVIWFVPVQLHAQENPDARTLFAQGTAAYEEEQWLSCATNFEGAFQAVFASELLYNIGLCYDNASRGLPDLEAAPLVERAEAAYRRFVRELPAATEVVSVRARLYELHQFMERVRRGSSMSDTSTESAVVVIPSESPVALTVDSDPEEEEEILLIPDAVVLGVVDSSFDYTVTTVLGSVTLVSFLVAVGLSFAAQSEFDHLVSSCGNSLFGCSVQEADQLVTLSTAANFMYAASGVLLAATGVAFGVEFDLSTPSNFSAAIQFGARF